MAWTLDTASQFCTELELLIADLGWHVAVTGGCLYKTGDRKDLDLVLYPANLPHIAKPDEVWECFVNCYEPTVAPFSKVAICRLKDGRRVDFLMRGEFMIEDCKGALPAPGY